MKKRMRWMSVPLVMAMVLSPIQIEQAQAEMSTLDKNRMLGATSQDWQSTSLREWLNSEKMKVDFTSLPPSYENEPGFLSDQNFTATERAAIAVTRHGHGWQYSLSGNTNDTLYYSQRSVSHNDFVSNDKVFILHYTDIMNYIERNKLLLDRYKKNYSNYLQSQTNKRDKYDYVVNSGYYNSGYVGTAVQFTSGLRQVNARDDQNIVPALSLKPDYTLSNGKKASALLVGDMVTFGKYNGESIEWEVINKSDDGHPLLWSTRILAVKEYDQEGDINPRTSSYINFPTLDVDISSGNGQAKSRETQENIDSTTTVTFPNESVLTTPTNDTSITLQIKATDSKYGIRKMTLPDGRVVNGGEAEWTFDKNGEYDILVENEIGVLTVKHIITKAINTPAVVNITTTKDESSKWTNKPVTVTVSASNNGVYDLVIRGNREMGYSGGSSGTFPSWMPLGGKRVHIKGVFRNAMTAEELASVPNAKIRLRGNYTWYNSGQRGSTYPVIKEIDLNDLYNKGEIVIDEIYVMPDNVYQGFSFSANLMDNNTAYMKDPYNYWRSDLTYEILDKDDLKIEEITFPDGTTTSSDTASYVLTNNGSYTFSVRDNRGKVTSKTIDVAVDTTKPTISISGIKPTYVKEQTLTIVTADTESGVKRVRLPNGEYRNMDTEGRGLTVEYNIVKNGSYTFLVEDYAGNTQTQTVSITNIDDTAPVAQENLSTEAWTKDGVTIEVDASDSQSGVKSIELPNGVKVFANRASYRVTQNGNYAFIIEDLVGNVSVKNVSIATMDTTAPTGTTSQSPSSTTWTKGNVTISLNGVTDGTGSGIKHIELPNGTFVSGVSASQVVSANGVYTFKVVDNVGNTRNYPVTVTNIDRVSPVIQSTLIPGTSAMTIRFTATDDYGVVKSITLPNGTVVTGATANFLTTEAGTYTATVEDMAGNRSTVSTTLYSPSVTLEKDVVDYTNLQTYTTVVRGTPRYGASLSMKSPFSSTWVNANQLNIEVSRNGEYAIEINDGGIKSVAKLTVLNFDRENPDITLSEEGATATSTRARVQIEDRGDER